MKYEFHGCWLLLHSIRIKDHVHDAQIKVSQSVWIPHSIWPTVTLYVCSTDDIDIYDILVYDILKILDPKLFATSTVIPKVSLWTLPCLSVNYLYAGVQIKKSVQTEQINPLSLKTVNSPV